MYGDLGVSSVGDDGFEVFAGYYCAGAVVAGAVAVVDEGSGPFDLVFGGGADAEYAV